MSSTDRIEVGDIVDVDFGGTCYWNVEVLHMPSVIGDNWIFKSADHLIYVKDYQDITRKL